MGTPMASGRPQSPFMLEAHVEYWEELKTVRILLFIFFLVFSLRYFKFYAFRCVHDFIILLEWSLSQPIVEREYYDKSIFKLKSYKLSS